MMQRDLGEGEVALHLTNGEILAGARISANHTTDPALTLPAHQSKRMFSEFSATYRSTCR